MFLTITVAFSFVLFFEKTQLLPESDRNDFFCKSLLKYHLKLDINLKIQREP